MLLSYSLNAVPNAALSIEERGLHYGDGLFETIVFVNQSPVLWQAHIDRLLYGCDVLNLVCPSHQQLLSDAKAILPKSGFSILKIIISRGVGGRGYRPPLSTETNTYLLAYRLNLADCSEAIDTRLCTTPWSLNPKLAGLKTLNRLDQVLAQAECQSYGVDEGVMTDGSGQLLSGTKSNLFLLEGQVLITPMLDQAGIAGTLREYLLQESTSLGFQSEVCRVNVERMKNADAAFFTNSVMGVLPIKSFEGKSYSDSPELNHIQKQIQERLGIPCL